MRAGKPLTPVHVRAIAKANGVLGCSWRDSYARYREASRPQAGSRPLRAQAPFPPGQGCRLDRVSKLVRAGAEVEITPSTSAATAAQSCTAAAPVGCRIFRVAGSLEKDRDRSGRKFTPDERAAAEFMRDEGCRVVLREPQSMTRAGRWDDRSHRGNDQRWDVYSPTKTTGAEEIIDFMAGKASQVGRHSGGVVVNLRNTRLTPGRYRAHYRHVGDASGEKVHCDRCGTGS